MSVSNFFRHFKAATGTSPIDWLKRERINQAKRRLIETEDPLAKIAEEAGVTIDLTRRDYHGSQPWPFPSGIMLGYHARLAAGSGAARPDGVEISELRWFTRAELLAAATEGSVRMPPPLSIARRLIEHWYGAELPGSWSRP